MNTIVTDIHYKLTSKNKEIDSKKLVLEFAKELGWNPSYFIPPSREEKSNGYLVIEHGLQNSAIISFLNIRNEELTNIEEENLLSLSYNNLVNWHITIDERYVNYYFILNKEKRKVDTRKIEVGNEAEALSIETFYEIIEKKPNSNIRALDDVLIENISNWKRIISAEFHNQIDLVSLSHLFNTIIFLRSIEDSKKRNDEIPHLTKILIDIISNNQNSNLSQIVINAEKVLNQIPDFIVSKERLKLFDNLSLNDLKRMFNSFYENEYNRFKYDFSIMTKQALSRIYQKYVSLLSISDLDYNETNLFGFSPIPYEKINKQAGAFYTPEYIARFFAKYISKKYSPKEFENLKILEPAVGSGIFLRTLLETQIEERIIKNVDLQIDKLFNNVMGIDNDANACLATNLSLTLLHYVFNNQLTKPNVIHGDSIPIMEDLIKKNEYADIIISNPPYINQNKRDKEFTEPHKEILGELTNGKVDVYQVFLKLSVDLLNPNGLGLFVLPHNFLTSESSKKLRNYILKYCNIEVVADLSAINVFENVSTYTMLLILRKKENTNQINSSSWLLKCRSSVGEALNQLLHENESDQKQYQVYKANNYFKLDSEWYILNKSEFDLLAKMKENRSIDDFLKLTQGVVSGKDSVFIRNSTDIPKQEKSLYKQFLPDKKISQYISENDKNELIFYPFINNELIEEESLIKDFPITWDYLNSNKNVLSNERGKVIKGQLSWWKLHSAGNSQEANSPKIVAPYLSITPKFSLDIKGNFITSRSPYFTLKENGDSNLLYYFLGILNSIPCYWTLSMQAHKQASGYNIFTIKTLKKTPVPDPTITENFSLVNKMIILVKKRVSEKNSLKQFEMEQEINNIACELYKLTSKEKDLLGINL
ncbi:Eco57I restriction-modification methylase domain-containing protein [Flavobacterium soli]|uniref:Eco57I restriction-modification methylase domain-containing protein n=1 Tax=Flavobacterium soli TaxID=344881 RepID=UPI00042A63BF|nr:Eco57I restriction-modification methylase domain-containing protein [Flavobacterium soli]